jgi:hypothetical protein
MAIRGLSIVALAIGWLTIGAVIVFVILARPGPDWNEASAVFLIVFLVRTTLAVAVPSLAIGIALGAFAVWRERSRRLWFRGLLLASGAMLVVLGVGVARMFHAG